MDTYGSNENDIVEHVQDELDLAQNQSKDITETLLEIIKSTLESGEALLISGFGKFSVKDKKARNGRNPATGDTMVLRKRRAVRFHCSSNLRKKINGE